MWAHFSRQRTCTLPCFCTPRGLIIVTFVMRAMSYRSEWPLLSGLNPRAAASTLGMPETKRSQEVNKRTLFAAIISLIAGSALFAPSFRLVAAVVPAPQERASSQVQQRIELVQNNLLPSVVVKGRPGEMKLAERMEHHKIP